MPIHVSSRFESRIPNSGCSLLESSCHGSLSFTERTTPYVLQIWSGLPRFLAACMSKSRPDLARGGGCGASALAEHEILLSSLATSCSCIHTQLSERDRDVERERDTKKEGREARKKMEQTEVVKR